MEELKKSKTWADIECLVANGDIEILIAEDYPSDCNYTTLLIQDNRRTYEEGEIYEVVIPD